LLIFVLINGNQILNHASSNDIVNRLSAVRRQVVRDSRSSFIESSVAEIGARPTFEKRTSVIQT